MSMVRKNSNVNDELNSNVLMATKTVMLMAR